MSLKTDVVIVGAGPVGLFAVFELGLQGLSSCVVDSMLNEGGQCTELYPDKPIFDIPAIPECTGQQLIDNLKEQIAPIKPGMYLDQSVDVVEKRGEQDFLVKTSTGNIFECRALIVAAGGGSFTPVRARLPGIEKFEDTQLYYRVRKPDSHAGKDIVILGGGDSALDWAIELAPIAKSLTLVNRTDRFRAAASSVEKLQAIEKDGKAKILMGTLTAFEETDDKLTDVTFTLRQA